MRALAPLALLLLAAAAPARAVGSFAPAAGQPQAADRTPLSLDALRACATKMEQAKKETADLKAQAADHDQRRAEVDKTRDALEQQRTTLDPHNTAAVRAFNAKAARFKADQDSLNRDVQAGNARNDQHTALLRSIDSDCRGHAFYQDDMATVIQEHPDAGL